jgi:hypothetical protein
MKRHLYLLVLAIGVSGQSEDASDVYAKSHADVDRYVERSWTPSRPVSSNSGLANGVKAVAGSALDMRPAVYTIGPKDLAFLVVCYSLYDWKKMGPGTSSFTLRVYGMRRNRVELLDETGSDFAGYSRISVARLDSPDSVSFLVSGYLTGANGPNNRMRLYTVRNGKFRTIWIPADIWGEFSANVSGDRFSITGSNYPDDAKRHEEYVVIQDGVVLSRANRR